MPYSYASSTGSQHGTLDGYDVSSFVIDPEDQSTRTDIRLRESAKAYRYWGGNKKAPVNVNSSYIANAFPDFSQTGSVFGSERSIENGRAAKTRLQQPISVPIARAASQPQAARKLSEDLGSRMPKIGAPRSLPRSPPRTPPRDRLVPAHLRYTMEPGYVPPHLKVSEMISATKKTTISSKDIKFSGPRQPSPPIPDNIVSGATEIRSDGQRRRLTDIHARVADETEASYLSDERPTLTFTTSSKSRFQVPPISKAPSSLAPALQDADSSFESIAADFKNAFERVSVANSSPRAQIIEGAITPPLSDKGAQVQKTTPHSFGFDTTTAENRFGTASTTAAVPNMSPSQGNVSHANNTQFSFAMPEIPDISKILGSSYRNIAPRPKAQDGNQSFYTRPRPRSAGEHDLIRDVPIPADEKDLYFAIQALQVQVMQLKEENKQQQQANGVANTQMNVLNTSFVATQGRNIEVERELSAMKAEKAQAELDTQRKLESIQRSHRDELQHLQSSLEATKVDARKEIDRLHQNHASQIDHLRHTHTIEIRKLQESAEAAEVRATNLEAEVTKVRNLIVRNKDAEDMFRGEIKNLESEIKSLQAESYAGLTRCQTLQQENDHLRVETAKRREADSAFGEDEKSEIHTLKVELDQAHQEIAQSHQQIHLALSTIERLREEYLKLQDKRHAPSATASTEVHGDNKTDRYEDEPTLRPSQPPGAALRAVIARLTKELEDEKALLGDAEREYAEILTGYRSHRRIAAKERIEVLLRNVESRHETLYDLHDVLEAGI